MLFFDKTVADCVFEFVDVHLLCSMVCIPYDIDVFLEGYAAACCNSQSDEVDRPRWFDEDTCNKLISINSLLSSQITLSQPRLQSSTDRSNF